MSRKKSTLMVCPKCGNKTVDEYSGIARCDSKGCDYKRDYFAEACAKMAVFNK